MTQKTYSIRHLPTGKWLVDPKLKDELTAADNLNLREPEGLSEAAAIERRSELAHPEDWEIVEQQGSDLEVPFVVNRTYGLCQEGSDGGNFEFEWNDAKKQALIRGDRINSEFLKWILNRPKFGPRHDTYPGLTDENKLYIEPDFTVFVEIKGQFFRVNRAGGDVVLVPILDSKDES